MKMTRKLILGVSAAFSSLAVAGVGATAFKTADIKTPLSAGVAQTERRIWVFDSDPNWWGMPADAPVVYANFEIHAWDNAGMVFDGKLVRTHGGYHGGLYYADIPAKCTGLLFHETGVWNDGKQTSDQPIPEFGTADVYNITSGLNAKGHRNCVRGTAPMSTGEVQRLLSYYDTCDSSQAFGYMSYPQLMANFISPSRIEDGNEVYEGSEEQGFEGKLPTIREKLDAMKAKYLAHK